MEVRLLGAMEVVAGDGTAVPVPGAKLRALLALLALDCGRVVATDRLIEDLWGDDSPADAANALQRLVSKLRKAVGPDLVVTRAPGYALAIDHEQVDVLRVERLLVDGRAACAAGDLERGVALFAEAEEIWRGTPLADFAYEDFAQPHITRLQELRLSLLEDRIDAELTLARHARLVSDLEMLVGANPLRERLRGQLMVALYRDGRQADALRVFQEGRAVLAEELGLDPGPELRRLESAILAQDAALDAPAIETIFPPPVSSRQRTNVKAALTPLVGRTKELDEVETLLTVARLVTLTGPGGAGKTRLAIETARRAMGQQLDAVFVIELAPVADPGAIPESIASTLELTETSLDPLGRACDYCSGKQLLVVLDNCEHVVDAAARVVDELLGACDGLRILATSREALRVAGERVWPVPPLPSDEAVELFVQRALAADPSFTADNDALLIAQDICGRLDGMPLAIELAAARLQAFPIAQIADRLDDRFRLLTAGSRAALPRQQTLRAVVDWSYDLLFEDERKTFERLSVFPGGFTLDAAVQVCPGDDLDPDDIADLVGSLVDKSLVIRDRSGRTPRYRQLQTLVQYGQERLDERGDAAATRQRMAAVIASLCDGSRDAFRGRDQRNWVLTVADEHDNIRAAFEYAVETQQAELAVRIAAGLGWQGWIGGTARDTCRRLDTAFAIPGDVAPEHRAEGLQWRSYLGFLALDTIDFDARFDESRSIQKAMNAHEALASNLLLHSQIASERGDRKLALDLAAEAGAVLADVPQNPWTVAMRTFADAICAVHRGEPDQFHTSLREAARHFDVAGCEILSAITSGLVADFDERRGDFASATKLLQYAHDVAAGLHLHGFEGSALARLGIIAWKQGNFEEADAYFAQALAIGDELGYQPIRAQTLAGIANLRRQQDRLDEAEVDAQEALTLYRGETSQGYPYHNTRFGVPGAAATCLGALGFIHAARGDARAAAQFHMLALAQARLTANVGAVARALEGIADAAVADGDAAHAARLLGHAAALRSADSSPLCPSERRDVDRSSNAASALLGRSAFDAAFEQGREAELDGLVSELAAD